MKKPLLVSFLLLTLILGACGGGSLEGEEVTITGALIGADQYIQELNLIMQFLAIHPNRI
jgi:ABC-type glycerol-3-phosphate transport system substrate-binding protein